MGALRSQKEGDAGFPASAWRALPQTLVRSDSSLKSQLFQRVSSSGLGRPITCPWQHAPLLAVSPAGPWALVGRSDGVLLLLGPGGAQGPR